MKRLHLYIIGLMLVFASSCTKDFETINDDPNTVNEINPGYQFVNIQLNYAGNGYEEWRGNLIMAGPLAGVSQDAYTSGEGFSISNGYAGAKWTEIYKDGVKNARDMISKMSKKNDSGDYNAKIAETEVMLAIMFQRLTDIYGDIPYTQGGLGYESQILYPEYDTQESVYKDLVKKLKENRDILMSTDKATFGSSEDIIYGHVDASLRAKAWAKLANSMLLRIGMRASSADLAWAQGVVEEAAGNAAGMIDSYQNTDAAMVTHSTVGGPWGSHENGSGSAINGMVGGFAYAYVGDEYLHRAQQTKDPRIFYIGAQVIKTEDGSYKPWTGQSYFNPFEEAARPGQPWKPVSFASPRGASESEGFRGAFTYNDAADAKQTATLLYFIQEADINSGKIKADSIQFMTLCGINPGTAGSRVAPTVVFGGDETNFILAEAAARGWNVSGDALTYLKKADKLAIDKHVSVYPTDGSAEKYMELYATTTGDNSTYEQMRDAYLLNITDASIETIQIERWKSLIMNGYEAFALWNRTNLNYATNGDANTTGIPYSNGGSNGHIDLPHYDAGVVTLAEIQAKINAHVADPSVSTAFPTTAFTNVLSHNGGDTEGIRPRRMDYPNGERTINADHVKSAIDRQQSAANSGYNGKQFITTKMWISKKN